MSKPIKMWPPGGGVSIKVLPHNVKNMKAKGWKDKQPTAKKKSAQKKEDLEHGKP